MKNTKFLVKVVRGTRAAEYVERIDRSPVKTTLKRERLNEQDLDGLEKMLIEAGAGTREDLIKVRSGSGLGLFVRSLVGLDREAAKVPSTASCPARR